MSHSQVETDEQEWILPGEIKQTAEPEINTWTGPCAHCGSQVKGGGENYHSPVANQQVLCLWCR